MADQKYELHRFDDDWSDVIGSFGTLDEALTDLEGRIAGTFYGAPDDISENCLADTQETVSVNLRCNYEPFDAPEGKFSVSSPEYDVDSEYDNVALAATEVVRLIRKSFEDDIYAQIFLSGLTAEGDAVSIEMTSFEDRQPVRGQ